MIVELSVVEQRYQAVLEVLHDGATVTDVARRHGVARQTLHEWLRRYGSAGLAGLVDGSARPLSCPHQMPPEVEARIVELRREHSGGDRARSAMRCCVRRWGRYRRCRRSIGVWCVTG